MTVKRFLCCNHSCNVAQLYSPCPEFVCRLRMCLQKSFSLSPRSDSHKILATILGHETRISFEFPASNIQKYKVWSSDEKLFTAKSSLSSLLHLSCFLFCFFFISTLIVVLCHTSRDTHSTQLFQWHV